MTIQELIAERIRHLSTEQAALVSHFLDTLQPNEAEERDSNNVTASFGIELPSDDVAEREFGIIRPYFSLSLSGLSKEQKIAAEEFSYRDRYSIGSYIRDPDGNLVILFKNAGDTANFLSDLVKENIVSSKLEPSNDFSEVSKKYDEVLANYNPQRIEYSVVPPADPETEIGNANPLLKVIVKGLDSSQINGVEEYFEALHPRRFVAGKRRASEKNPADASRKGVAYSIAPCSKDYSGMQDFIVLFKSADAANRFRNFLDASDIINLGTTDDVVFNQVKKDFLKATGRTQA